MRYDGTITTAHLTDACLRLRIPARQAPFGIRAVVSGTTIVGGVRPARHYGSVDVFLEAIEEANAGDVLVVDNAGRLDEGCVGDLITIEAQTAGLGGIVIWGAHRDTAEIRRLGFPVFSLGAVPRGPIRLDAREDEALRSARIGEWEVTPRDVVVADDDGVVFLDGDALDEIYAAACAIRDREVAQADKIRTKSLRQQFAFERYLEARRVSPELTFRQHLRSIEGSIEE